ncbi:MAG: hypothetical protein CMJ64_18530 [Planctomycetaceae bacterium]|nr:hypothetical protein [Planctomycetaceae bacterium]
MRVLEKLEFRPNVERSFSSRCASQLWVEWHLKGYSLAATAGFVTIPLAVWFCSGYLNPKEVVVIISAFTMMGTMATSLFGMFLGQQGEQFDVKEFVAVRPLTDTELADVILLNTAKTLLLGWIV